VILREVRGTYRVEEPQMEKKLEKLVFELRNEEHDSEELTESDEEVEQPTSIIRRSERVRKPTERYNPHDFH
jgi:hypothetical protein